MMNLFTTTKDTISNTKVFRNQDNTICINFFSQAYGSVSIILTDEEFNSFIAAACEFVEFEPEFGGYRDGAITA